MTPSDLPDFPTIAGFYSQLAGVLAGFAFAGLVALIATQLTKDSLASHSLHSYLPLVSAFVGLVATSLNYAIVAGEDKWTKRATTLEVVSGIGFASAGLMLLYSVLILMHGLHRDNPTQGNILGSTTKILRRAYIYGVCPILGLLIYGAIHDFTVAKYGHDTSLRGVNYAALVMTVVYLAWTVFIAKRFTTRTLSSHRSTVVLAASAMTISLVTVLTSSLTLSFTAKDYPQTDLLPLACYATFIAFAMIFAYSTRRIDTSAQMDRTVSVEEETTDDNPEVP